MYSVIWMKKTLGLFVALFVPYVAGLVYLARTDPSGLPPWALRTIPIYFVTALVVLAIWGRPKVSSESTRASVPVTARRRRLSLSAILVYVIVLINAIVIIVRESVPLHIAAPAMAIIALMIWAYAWLHARSRSNGEDGGCPKSH
jgi:hypothetical protein